MQLKLAATIAGSFGAGALLSWAVTADFWQKRTSDVAFHIVEYYDGLLPGRVPDTAEVELEEWYISDPENPRGDDSDEVDDTDVSDEAEVEPEQTEEEVRSNLQSIIDQYTATEDADSEQTIRSFVKQVVDNDDPHFKPPYVISTGTFSWDEEGEKYDKVTVTYYPQHRVVIDDDGDVMDNVAGVLGWANLNRFGDMSEQADVVFIRNEKIMTDYEVVRDEDVPPLHVRYGMGKEEFEVTRASGRLRLRDEDL